MTGGTFERRWLIEKNWLVINDFYLFVTLIARNLCVASGQRQVRARIVIKRRRDPSQNVVALRATSLSPFCELPAMGLDMAVFADLRCSFELRLMRAGRSFVACAASYRAMRTEQRKLGLRMIKAVYVRPGPYVVAGFTAKWRSVRPTPSHALFEFTFVRINVTCRTGLVFKMKRHCLICASSASDLVALIARHGHVSSG